MFGVSFAALVRVDDDELTSFSTSVASTPASFSIAAMCALISVRTVCSHLASADPAPLVEAQQHETHLEVAHDRLVNLARERRVVLRQRPVAIPDLIKDLLPCAPPNPTTSASRAARARGDGRTAALAEEVVALVERDLDRFCERERRLGGGRLECREALVVVQERLGDVLCGGQAEV